MSVKQLVDSAIAENSVTIFSKSYCPYCKRAKALIASELPNAQVKIFELDEIDEGSDIQAYLADLTGQRTVPNVFIKQQHIGGSDDLAAAHREKGIKNLL
ncbi:glutaredoxin [Artomyces pyxidatus]|uniref:Glutaredoxin n=1 Tax=Artomyces pyxidatus TaxID=48021 RepID=A0ACB8SST1_9AGAM|nr:glutaredoxin [Artomyces pyxidatus]